MLSERQKAISQLLGMLTERTNRPPVLQHKLAPSMSSRPLR